MKRVFFLLLAGVLFAQEGFKINPPSIKLVGFDTSEAKYYTHDEATIYFKDKGVFDD